jgi:hypothetical protein
MIDLSMLTEEDKGRIVIFETPEKRQFGVISSWNKRFIFVKYDNFQSQATRPEDLRFALS